MAERSKIEWCDHTFNPWTGCTKVSPACDNCYAEGWAKRSGHVKWGPHGDRRRTKTWGDPVKWNKRLEGTGLRESVFCASLADVFDKHRSIDPAWRHDLWELIAQTPNLIWLLLTKRPQNVLDMVPVHWLDIKWPQNVWIGTTVENQTEADRRIPHLLRLPAPVRFLSCEPLLGPLRISTYMATGWDGDIRKARPANRVDWVIAGGESGSGARPMHPEWLESLRDQCQAAGVPFHFKQWGDWYPVNRAELGAYGEWVGPKPQPKMERIWATQECGYYCSEEHGHVDHRAYLMKRIGKKAAGRRLDGREWNEVPALGGGKQ